MTKTSYLTRFQEPNPVSRFTVDSPFDFFIQFKLAVNSYTPFKTDNRFEGEK